MLARIGRFRVLKQSPDSISTFEAVDDQGVEAIVELFPSLWLPSGAIAAKGLWARIGHPAFARVLEVGEDASIGHAYFAKEKLLGETLYELRHRGPADVAEAVSVARQILEAASALNAAGYTLTGFDGSDIRVAPGANGPVVRVDIRLALHPTGKTVCPTIGPHDERADVWLVGAILYSMLTGAAPFAGESFAELSTAILQGPPPVFRTELGVPLALQQAVWKALEKKPENRFANAREFAKALI